MPSTMRRLPVGLIFAALVAVLAGCSTTVAGSAAKTTVPAPAGAVDLALLDAGNYPTKPRPPLGTAGNTDKGALLEGARLANNVVGPWQLDPTLIANTHAGEGPGNFAAAFSVATAQAAVAHQLLAVFKSNRTNAAGDRDLINAVMRFPSPQDAAAAAADMTAASTHSEVLGDPIDRDPIPIPRYPATSGLVHFWDTLGKWSVEAFTAHGPYVLSQYSGSTQSAEAATELIAATLDKQGPLIDAFQPTPIDQLKDLPIDPDGLLARTLPLDKGAGSVYGPTAQLHFDNDPIKTKAFFDDAHLQQVAGARVQVYQTPDGASAKKIVDGFAAETAQHGFGPAAGVKGLPDAKCLTQKGTSAMDTSFYCVAVVDRFAVEVSATQERDAHQLISAQYLMLTGK